MDDVKRYSLCLVKKMVENYPDEMSFVREYKEQITLTLYNICTPKIGRKPRITEEYIHRQETSEVEDEVFRWTVSCHDAGFMVSLVKDELVCWGHDSVFKGKHHSVPINTGNISESISSFMQRIASHRPDSFML